MRSYSGYAGLLFFAVIPVYSWVLLQRPTYIYDISRTWSMKVHAIEKPHSKSELKKLVIESTKPIAIAGGRYSQGGQIAYPDALIIDTTGLNSVVSFDKENKLITVEAGMVWREVQRYIDPHNLSIAVMQSYNDFTVGGSLSVNVHGRMIRNGPFASTIQSFELLTANGEFITVDRENHSDLFRAVIGGYGLLGIVTQVTLRLVDNHTMERHIVRMPYSLYCDYFFNTVLTNDTIYFHNAVLYPNRYTMVDVVTWHKTAKKVTIPDRLQSWQHYYFPEMMGEMLLRRVTKLKEARPLLETKLVKNPFIVWRNYEMSHNVRTLEPLTRIISSSILQEYFVPVDLLDDFIRRFRFIVKRYNVNILNASIRYVPADTESLLAYAPTDSFAIVLYINVINSKRGLDRMKLWTREFIDTVLAFGGRYYLPYHLFATKEQFYQAYPEFNEFLAIKKRYDPTNKFTNMLLNAYLQ